MSFNNNNNNNSYDALEKFFLPDENVWLIFKILIWSSTTISLSPTSNGFLPANCMSSYCCLMLSSLQIKLPASTKT